MSLSLLTSTEMPHMRNMRIEGVNEKWQAPEHEILRNEESWSEFDTPTSQSVCIKFRTLACSARAHHHERGQVA